MKKILIIGSRGMAGHMIKSYLKKNNKYVVEDVARQANESDNQVSYNFDVYDTFKLASLICNSNYDVVINCVGSLNRDAEENPDKAIFLNSYLPHFLAAQCKSVNSRLIHISTDCVFSGKRGGYLESDQKDGLGVYAQSKALGEVTYDAHLTFRTSIIGPELKDGIGLLHWFLKQKDSVKGYSKAFWTGVTTLELAKAIETAIDQKLTGLYHLVYPEKISKYDLLILFNEVFKTNLRIEKDDVYAVDKSLINNRKDFNYKVRSYKEMMAELLDWMKMNAAMYTHYTY